MIIIQVGEKKEYKHISNWLESYGFHVDCYWYPKEITEQELEMEIANLQPFTDYLVIQR